MAIAANRSKQSIDPWACDELGPASVGVARVVRLATDLDAHLGLSLSSIHAEDWAGLKASDRFFDNATFLRPCNALSRSCSASSLWMLSNNFGVFIVFPHPAIVTSTILANGTNSQIHVDPSDGRCWR